MSRKSIVGLLILIAGIIFSIPALRVLTAGPGTRFTIVPFPKSIKPHRGSFVLQPQSRILVDPAARDTGEYLAGVLRRSTSYQLPVVVQVSAQAEQGSLLLTTNNAKPGLGPEGYEFTSTRDSVAIRAPAPAGLFYGAQSLLQLLPPQIFS